MQSKLIWAFLILTTFVECLHGQTHVGFYLADATTKEAISGAHIFINDTSIGSFSNDDGSVSLISNDAINNELVISHISYQDQKINRQTFLKLISSDTIFLVPDEIEISSIMIKGERDKNWKKKLKKLRTALLGSGKAAKECEIINPEALRFKTEDNILYANSVGPLEIENKHLGYQIKFLLNELEIKKDGSSKYLSLIHI